MGYTTDFDGSVAIDPPLSEAERDYLNAFAGTRRMKRKNGPYYCGTDIYGQDEEADIIDYNEPPEGQPGLWCQWVASEEGTALEWDGGEKFYHAPEWMEYIIDHFLAPGAEAAKELPFLTANHTVNGVIYAQGRDRDDIWRLIVEDNTVRTERTSLVWPGE